MARLTSAQDRQRRPRGSDLDTESMTTYRGHVLEVSGPAGGWYWVTIQGPFGSVKDLKGRSTKEVLDKAADWIDATPGMNPRTKTLARRMSNP